MGWCSTILSMKSYIFGVLVLFGALSLPTCTQAYLTTAQSSTDLGNGSALFTVTYKFGFLNREVYMPILASRSKDFTDTGMEAGYSILFDGETEAKATSTMISSTNAQMQLNYSVLPGKAKAIVLSDAQIKDGRYFLPKGKSGTFTLVAVVDISKAANTQDMSLLMTSLPFTMIADGKRAEARLNPSELQYYKTPEVSLKK
jgi:hypothetical protein